jgi:1,4-dihydroxy-2-naphthoate octaprenyltransferase
VVWAIGWFGDNLSYLILIALSVVLGATYSVRPFRLKGKPFLDLFANAIGYGGIAFLIGWRTVAPLDTYALLRTIPYILCVGAAFVNNASGFEGRSSLWRSNNRCDIGR